MSKIKIVKEKYATEITIGFEMYLDNLLLNMQLKTTDDPEYHNFYVYLSKTGKAGLVNLLAEVKDSEEHIYKSTAQSFIENMLINWDEDCICIVGDEEWWKM